MKCRILSFAPRLVAAKKENAVLLRLLGEDAGILKELSLDVSSSIQVLQGLMKFTLFGNFQIEIFKPSRTVTLVTLECFLHDERHLVLKVYWVFVFLLGTKTTFPLFLRICRFQNLEFVLICKNSTNAV